MSDRLKSIVFAAALCAACSLLLTAASTGLKGYQQANIKIDRQRNILKSVGLVASGTVYSKEDIQRLYEQNITLLSLDENGQVLPQPPDEGDDLHIYLYRKPDGAVASYVVPINTRGLWGKIRGYLAIESDGSTVSGFTVYQHGETPGLGGEIESAWFQKQFKGKKIVDQGGRFVSIAIAKGAVKDTVPRDRQANYVDGISGATLTGKFLSSGIKDILMTYEPISIKFRTDQLRGGPVRATPSAGAPETNT